MRAQLATTMTLTEAEICLSDSRRKLASYENLAAQAPRDSVLDQIRQEIVRLELVVQRLPSRSVKIHRLIQAWRRCHTNLWAQS